MGAPSFVCQTDVLGNVLTPGGSGTAGSPAGGVQSVQGVSGGTAVPISQALSAAMVDGTDTNVTAGTRRALGSLATPFGCYVTNTHATAIAFIGSTSVSSTRFVFKIYPGQSTQLIPVSNANGISWDTDISGCTVSYGGA
jgi:hypothetical protein